MQSVLFHAPGLELGFAYMISFISMVSPPIKALTAPELALLLGQTEFCVLCNFSLPFPGLFPIDRIRSNPTRKRLRPLKWLMPSKNAV